MNNYLLEVCVDSMESVREAVRGGAHRLELCANLIIGGTTPSPWLISEAAKLGLPVNVLIRPRFGDFLFSQDEKLVSANMRYVAMLEEAICEQTGMRTNRERPDVELWVLCRPEAAYFLWRIGKRSNVKQEGQLRSDVCAVISFLSGCGGKNAAILSCTSSSLAYALKAGGARMLNCVCPDKQNAKVIAEKVRGVRVQEGSSGYTDMADASQHAVVLHLPVKAEKTERLESDLRNALYEARRILQEDGKIIVVAALDHAQATLRKTQGVRVLGRYDLVLSGQKSAIWILTGKSDDYGMMDEE